MPTEREIAAPLQLLSLGLGRDEAQAPEELELGAFLCARPDLELLECIGRGGMGVVYKARQTGLDRVVAVKVMDPQFTAEPAFASRFAKEARAMAKLDHPGIVRVFDFGEAGGSFFLLMACVDGPNLRTAMESGELERARALELVADLCDAVAYAHAAGIIHRDIKPENILVGSDGHPRLADFGLAKRMSETNGSRQDHTATGDTMGTPHYAAPELFEDPRRADGRADLFSLAVVLYELLTGHLPLGRFDPPSASCSIGPQLDAAIMQGLERDPGQRLLDVKTLGRHLRDALQGNAVENPKEAAPPTKRRTVVATLGVAAAVVAGATWLARADATEETQPVEASAAAASEEVSPEPEIATPPPPPPLPSDYRPGWADHELAKMPADSTFFVGVDMVAFFRIPWFSNRRDRLDKYGSLVSERCGGTDPIQATNTILFAGTDEAVTLAVSGTWTSDALAHCLSYVVLGDDAAESQVEPYGEYRWLRTPGDAWDGMIVAADAFGHAIITSHRLGEEEVKQRLEDPTRDDSLAQRVARRVDTKAAFWIFAEFSEPVTSYGVTAVYADLSVWDESKTSLEIHVSNQEQAATLHQTLTVMMSQTASEHLDKVQLENHGTWVSLESQLPNETGLDDSIDTVPAQFLEDSLFLRVVFGDGE